MKPYKKGHYAAMEAKDLPEFLSKLHSNEGRLFPTTQLAIEMMMLTFVRTGELIKAKWDEFDFDEKVWIIPAPRMKMRKDHIVPLSEQVIERLKKLKAINGRWEYVFASQRTPRNHMSNNAILVALDRMGYRGEHKDKEISDLKALRATEKPINSKEKDTLLKMIIGMAVKG